MSNRDIEFEARLEAIELILTEMMTPLARIPQTRVAMEAALTTIAETADRDCPYDGSVKSIKLQAIINQAEYMRGALHIIADPGFAARMQHRPQGEMPEILSESLRRRRGDGDTPPPPEQPDPPPDDEPRP